MPNPADNYQEVSQTRYTSRNKGEERKIDEFLKTVRKEQWHRALIKEPDENAVQTYKIDIYDDGYSSKATLKDIDAYNLNPQALIEGTWPKGTPCMVKLLDTGQAYFVPDDIIYWLTISDPYDAEEKPNLFNGLAIDNKGGVADTDNQDKVYIFITFPFEFDPTGDPIPSVTHLLKRFDVGAGIPFKKFPFPIPDPKDDNDDPSARRMVIGQALYMSLLPNPKGLYQPLQVIDDEKTIDWDYVRFTTR